MQPDERHFSLVAINLIAALCAGDRRTGRLGEAFSHLGYRIHELEPTIEGERVTAEPDAVLCSAFQGQTLLVEVTGLDAPAPRKRRQMVAFDSIGPDDAVAYGVPPAMARHVDAWWLVRQAAAHAFEAPSSSSLLSALCVDSGGLSYVKGSVSSAETQQLLAQDHRLPALPFSIVRRSLDETSANCLVEGLVQEWVAALHRGDTFVASERLAQKLWPHAWRHLSNKKRAALVQSVDRAVGSVHVLLRQSIHRKDRQASGWRVVDGIEPEQASQKLRKASQRILEAASGQLTLFPDEEL